MKKVVLCLVVMISVLSMAAQAAMTVLDLPATGTDAAMGTSTGKAYTHTLDFGSGDPAAGANAINGVDFDKVDSAGSGTSRGNGYTVTVTGSNPSACLGILNAGTGDVDGVSQNLFSDFIYVGCVQAEVGDILSVTLSDLTAGTRYSTRIYYRKWSDSGRLVTIQGDGSGILETFDVNLDAGGAHYVDYVFIANDTDVTITFVTNVFNYGPHIYGLTNEVYSPKACDPDPADMATGVRMDAILSWNPDPYEEGALSPKYRISFSNNFNDVYNGAAVVAVQDANSYTPGLLDRDTTYYWRIDEANGAGGWYIGSIWQFATSFDHNNCGLWDYLQADLNRDCSIGLCDFAEIIGLWLTIDPEADITGDSYVDIGDVKALAQDWLKSGPFILHDEDNSTVDIQSRDKRLKLRINYSSGCFIDRFFIDNNQIVDQIIDNDNGISSAVKINSYWHLSKYESNTPSITIDGNSVTIEGISYGPGDFKIQEDWIFTTMDDAINWSIQRNIPSDRIVDAAANSHWEFADMDTWTGAMLDNGGVAWNKMLPNNFDTFGNHASKVLFWNDTNGVCFEVNPVELNGRHMASRFTRSPKGTLVFAQALSDDPVETRVNLSRFLGGNDAIWKPFSLYAGTQSMTYRLSVSELETRFDLGSFNGIDEDAVREILNTIVRYGVIDSKLCGANGWRSGYICLHEQWYAQIAMAMQCESYTRNVSETYDNFRDHAVWQNGRVLARFKDNSVDAMPGTYTEHGFYEAQWGYLLDSQPDYVMVVSEQFHNTGDLNWVLGQKQTCEAVLEYMLQRDSDDDGLLEMINSYHSDARGSDWIDIVWAAYENALVNAEMYQAMVLWSEIEEILGDHEKAVRYSNAAAKLKDSFNKDINEGGFWNPQNQWYVYWRDKDDSIHGDNLVIPVNFAAIGYGLCDDDAKKTAIVSALETAMQTENLFSWPLCVYSFEPEEASAGNFPFPHYENGDIFLSWAELGTRAYVSYNPDIALKYINNIINQYEQDGLAFQRYGRLSQNGLGGDILAGNGMAVVGLYRNIFGIQPQYNRLYLEPHLPEELDGTVVKYQLRDTTYNIYLNNNDYTVTANDFSICDQEPFGTNCDNNILEYFQGKSSISSLSFEKEPLWPLNIQIANFGDDVYEWSVYSSNSMNILQTLYNLIPGNTYHVSINSAAAEDKTADANGHLLIPITLVPEQEITVSVMP